MFTCNNEISGRQIRRMGILENIPPLIVFAPFVCAAYGTGLATLVVGIIFSLIYMLVMKLYGEAMKSSGIQYERELPRFFGMVNIIRYSVRAGFLAFVFTRAIKDFLMYGINEVVIFLSLIAVCFCGAAGSKEKRARLMELSFAWVIIPLVITCLIGLFNLDFGLLAESLADTQGGRASDIYPVSGDNRMDGADILRCILADFEKGETYLGAAAFLCVAATAELLIFLTQQKTGADLRMDTGRSIQTEPDGGIRSAQDEPDGGGSVQPEAVAGGRSVQDEPDRDIRSVQTEPDGGIRSVQAEPDGGSRSTQTEAVAGGRSVQTEPDRDIRSIQTEPDGGIRNARSARYRYVQEGANTNTRPASCTTRDISVIIAVSLISCIMGYVVIMGTLGASWAGEDIISGLSFMEAATNSIEGIKRIDYLVLTFFIIGIFAVISGYMFRANDFAYRITSGVWSGDLETETEKTSGRGKRSRTLCSLPVLILVLVAGLYFRGAEGAIEKFAWYMLCFDLPLSVIFPLTVLIKHRRMKRKIETLGVAALVVVLLIFTVTVTGCGSAYTSVENRDYATSLTLSVSESGSVIYGFNISDLSEYGGKPGDSIQELTVYIEAESIEEAQVEYLKYNEKALDIGHISEIIIETDAVEGDSSGTEAGDAENDSTEDGTTENDSAEGETTENDSTKDGTTKNDSTEDGATENYSAEDENTENDSTEDGATENDSAEDETTENDSTEDGATEYGQDFEKIIKRIYDLRDNPVISKSIKVIYPDGKELILRDILVL